MIAVKKTNHWGCILCTNLYRNYSSKSSRKTLQNDALERQIKGESARLLKKFNKENKLLFGSLVESLPQKRKREKTEPVSEKCMYSSDTDKLSEALWWKKSLMTKVKPKPTLRKLRTAESDEASISRNIADIEENYKIPKSGVSLSSTETNERIINGIDKSSVFHKSNLRLPQIIVKNLSIFPLENKKKQSLDLAPSNSTILNIPMKDDNSVRVQFRDYPSVSKVLNATLSDSARAALQKWKENMIAELGVEGFEKYQRGLLEHGRMFHKTMQIYLSGVPVDDIEIDSSVEGCWHSIEATVKEIGAVKVLESHVVHEELLYHGIIDCVAEYKGKLMLIEWKKSNKQKSAIWNTYDAPLQVAAYLGAINFDSNYDLKVNGGLVVVAYTDGSPAHVHPLNTSQCDKYWRMWLKRLQLYWDLFDKQDTNELSDMMTA